MRSLWLKSALLIAAIWLVAGVVILWAKSMKPTPEKLTRYLETHSASGSAAQRTQVIEDVAEQLNGLAYEERRELRVGRKLDGFFRSLNADEQARFLDLTLPAGFKQMMESLNNMEPEKRRKLVAKALKDMEERGGDGAPDPANDKNAQQMMEQGMKSFYTDASAETKMDVAPLLEQMQKNLQGGR